MEHLDDPRHLLGGAHEHHGARKGLLEIGVVLVGLKVGASPQDVLAADQRAEPLQDLFCDLDGRATQWHIPPPRVPEAASPRILLDCLFVGSVSYTHLTLPTILR